MASLAAEIRNFNEKKLPTLRDVVLLAKAVVEHEERRASSLLAKSIEHQESLVSDEEEQSSVEALPRVNPEIELAKKMLNEHLFVFKAKYGKELQKILQKYYDDRLLFAHPPAAANTKKIINIIIFKVDAEIALRALEEFNARLKEATDSLNTELSNRSRDMDSLEGVIDVQNKIEQLKSLISDPNFVKVAPELKENALSALSHGNRRLYTYATRYILYLVEIQRPGSPYAADIDLAKNTVATIIQCIFKNNSVEEALKYLKMLIQSARSNEEIAQFYDICLYRINNPGIQKELLKILNLEFIENRGLRAAYEIFNESNKTIQISLARTILSCEDISDVIAAGIADLEEDELIQLAGVLSPAEAIEYITKNTYIGDKALRARLVKHFEDDDGLKLKEYVKKTALAFIQAIDEGSSVVACNQSNRLLRIVTAALDSKAESKSVISAGLGDAIRGKEISYLKCMQITAEALRHSASSLEGYSHAELSARERVESKEQTLSMGFGAGFAMRTAMRRVEAALVNKEGLIKIIHNFIGVLVELSPDHAVENVEAIFNILLVQNKEEKSREEPTHGAEPKEIPAKCVQAACDICLGQENKKARFAFGKALLEGYCANLNDDQIDKLIEALVRVEPGEDLATVEFYKREIYIIFSAQPAEDRATMAAAILRNPSMRRWAISFGGLVFKEIFSSLDVSFADASNPKISGITDPEQRDAALKKDNLRRAAAIDNAKKLFANWTNLNFTKAVSQDTAGTFWWLHWGSLTRANAGGLTDAELKAEVQKLDLVPLSIGQIRALDKRTRMAILQYLGPWEEGSKKITRTVPFNSDFFKMKADALTYGFTATDIAELHGCETGLIIAFKNFPEAAARQMIAGPYPQRRAGWRVLQEVDHGFYRGAEQHWLYGNPEWLHDLIVTSVYQYEQADGYLRDGLERNLLVEADLINKKADFIADENTSVDAYKLILRSPQVIMSYKDSKTISQRLLTGLKGVLGVQEITGVKNELDAFVTSAATPCFGRPQSVSPRAFLESIQELRAAGRGTNEFKAGKLLIDTIPLFLRHNREHTFDDIQAMKELCDLYRYSSEKRNIKAKNKNENHYNQDPLVAALQNNQHPGAGSAAREVLGYVFFLHPFVATESKDSNKLDYVLLKGYLKQHRTYQIPESPVISWLRTFVWGLTIGALTGLATAIYAHFTPSFNPLKWFQTESIGDKLIGLAKLAAGGAVATATGLGIGTTAAGFIAAAVVGGVAVGVLFVTGRAAWQGITGGATRFGNWVRYQRGLEVIGTGQGEYEALSRGLECLRPEAFKAMIFDQDPTNQHLREDLIKNILFMADHGFEISNNKKIDKEIRRDIQILCDKYRKDNTPTVLQFLDNICSSIMWGISCMLTGVLSTLGFMISGGKIGVQMWSPVTPPWLKEKRYQELFQGAQNLMQQSAQVVLDIRGIIPYGGTQLQLEHKLRTTSASKPGVKVTGLSSSSSVPRSLVEFPAVSGRTSPLSSPEPLDDTSKIKVPRRSRSNSSS